MASISVQTRKIYSEVYAILDMLGEYYIKKLPNIIYRNIQELKLKDYNPKYDEDKSLKMQHVSRDAISMIAFFHLSYWCEDEEEKSNLKKLFKTNGEKNNFDIFGNNNVNLKVKEKELNSVKRNENIQFIEKTEENSNLPIEVKKENIFQRIIVYIKKFFKYKN